MHIPLPWGIGKCRRPYSSAGAIEIGLVGNVDCAFFSQLAVVTGSSRPGLWRQAETGHELSAGDWCNPAGSGQSQKLARTGKRPLPLSSSCRVESCNAFSTNSDPGCLSVVTAMVLTCGDCFGDSYYRRTAAVGYSSPYKAALLWLMCIRNLGAILMRG